MTTKLEALFDAVDDFLYVPGLGYLRDHCNPEYLEALRQAFLVAVREMDDNQRPEAT